MAHRAERLRKRAIREMEQQRGAAEYYSQTVNMLWDGMMREAFGLGWEINLEPVDCEWAWDAYMREVRKEEHGN